MALEITQYALAWNPTLERGFVRMQLSYGTNTRLNADSAAELAAVAAVLQQPAFITQGFIHNNPVLPLKALDETEVPFPAA